MKNPFTKERMKHLRGLSFDQFMALKAKDFQTSEIEYLIAETPLRDQDKRLCVMYFIKKNTHAEVMEEMGYSLSWSNAKKKQLHDEMLRTIIKMFFQGR